MLLSEVDAYRKKALGPAASAARAFFRSPGGRTVLDTLDRVFGRDLVGVDREGRVDPAAVLVRVGNKEVIDFLRGLAENQEAGE